MNVKHMMYLSGTLVAGALLFSPAVLEVHADQVTTPQVVNHVNSNNQAQQMAQKLDQDSIQLRNIKDNVQGTDYEKPVNEAITSVEKLKTSLRANSETVYDLNSIGSRVEALTDVIEAITFSTQHLANKVSQANIDMGFGITK
ncbi:CAMP factor pore-forming toxin Cfb-I, partial [Streptococcus agalactiae]